MEIFALAAATVAAILIVMLKTNIRRWLAFEVTVDIFATIGLGVLGAATGSFAGLVLGILAGLMLSVVLSLLKKLVGYERPTLKGWQMVRPAWRVTDEQVQKAEAIYAKSRRGLAERIW
jgi:hypothetical protein